MSLIAVKKLFAIRLVACAVTVTMLSGDIARAGPIPSVHHVAPQSLFQQEESLWDQATYFVRTRVMPGFWSIARTISCVFLFGAVGTVLAQKLGWAMERPSIGLVPPAAIPSDHVLVVTKDGKPKVTPGFSLRREVQPPQVSWQHEALDRGIQQVQGVGKILEGKKTGTALAGARRDWLNRPEFKGTDRVDFCWDPSVLPDEQSIEDYLQALARDGYTHVFYHVDLKTWERPRLGEQLWGARRAKLLLDKAHALGIRVTPLLGDLAWADPRNQDGPAMVRALLNMGLPFDDLALDIEGWVTQRSAQEIKQVKQRMQKIAAQFNQTVFWFTPPGYPDKEGVSTLLAVYETDINKIRETILRHKGAAKSDYVIVLEAGSHAEKAGMSFHGRQHLLPGVLQALLGDRTLNLGADPHFKGFAIHRDDGSYLQTMVDPYNGQWKLFQKTQDGMRYYAESLEEYFEGAMRLTPYGSEPPTWGQKAKNFAIGRVRALLGGVRSDFFSPIYESIMSSIGQSENRGELVITANRNAPALGAEGGIAFTIATGLTSLTLDPGDPQIHQIYLTVRKKGTSGTEGVIVQKASLMNTDEPLKLNIPQSSMLKDIELEFEFEVSGGTTFRELDAYVQLDIANPQLPLSSSQTTAPFRVKAGQIQRIKLLRPGTVLAEGVDTFSAKLIHDNQVVAQVGSYDIEMLRAMLRRHASDVAGKMSQTGADRTPNAMGLQAARVGASMASFPAHYFFQDKNYEKPLREDIFKVLRQSGISTVLVDTEDFLAQKMGPVTLQRLRDAARKYGVQIVRLNRLKGRDTSVLESPPQVPDVLTGPVPSASSGVTMSPSKEPLESVGGTASSTGTTTVVAPAPVASALPAPATAAALPGAGGGVAPAQVVAPSESFARAKSWLESQIIPSGDGALLRSYANNPRSWIYDQALGIISFTMTKDHDKAKSLIKGLLPLIREDGSLQFSYDAANPAKGDQAMVRTGALAWVGYAVSFYVENAGDAQNREEFLAFAKKIAAYVLARQVRDQGDMRYGLLTGGTSETNGPVAWCAVEHNLDSYFFLKLLAKLTGDASYGQAADLIRKSLLQNCWDDATEQFVQGINPEGVDRTLALDGASWGGIFLNANGQHDKVTRCERALQKRYGNAVQGVSGYKPYHDRLLYEDPLVAKRLSPASPGKTWEEIQSIWPEGGMGVATLLLKMGKPQEVAALLRDTARLQDAKGGIPYHTQEIPGEFTTQPHSGSTAWYIMVTMMAQDPSLLQKFWEGEGVSEAKTPAVPPAEFVPQAPYRPALAEPSTQPSQGAMPRRVSVSFDESSAELILDGQAFRNVQVRMESPDSRLFLDARGVPIASRDAFGNVLTYTSRVRPPMYKEVFTAQGESVQYVLLARNSAGRIDHVRYQIGNRVVIYYPASGTKPQRTVFTFAHPDGRSGVPLASVEFAGDKRLWTAVPLVRVTYGDSVVASGYEPQINILRAGKAESVKKKNLELASASSRIERNGLFSTANFVRLERFLSYREFKSIAEGPDAGRIFYERESEGSQWTYLYASGPGGKLAATIKIAGDHRSGLRNATATVDSDGRVAIQGGPRIKPARVDYYGSDASGMLRVVRSKTPSGWEHFTYDRDESGSPRITVRCPRGIRVMDTHGNVVFSGTLEGFQKLYYTNIPTAGGGWEVRIAQGRPDGPLVQIQRKDVNGQVVAFTGADGLSKTVREERASNGLVKKQVTTDPFGRTVATEFYVQGDETGMPQKITDHRGTKTIRYRFDSSGRVAEQMEEEGGRTQKLVLHTQGRLAGMLKSSSYGEGTPQEQYEYEMDDTDRVLRKKVITESQTLIYDDRENLVERISKTGDGHRYYQTELLADGSKVVTERILQKEGAGPRLWKVTYYDKWDQEILEKDAMGFDTGTRMITHKAGPLRGLPERRIDKSGRQIVYEHILDQNGRLIRTVWYPKDDPENKTVEDISDVQDPEHGKLLGRAYRITDPRGTVSDVSYRLDDTGALSATIVKTAEGIIEYDALGNHIAKENISKKLKVRVENIRTTDGGKVANEFVVTPGGKDVFVRQSRYDLTGDLRMMFDPFSTEGPKFFFPVYEDGKKVKELMIQPVKRSGFEYHRFEVRQSQDGSLSFFEKDAAGQLTEIHLGSLEQEIGPFEVSEFYTRGPLTGWVSKRTPNNLTAQTSWVKYRPGPDGPFSKEIHTKLGVDQKEVVTTVEFENGQVYSIKDPSGKKMYEVLSYYPNGRRRVMIYPEGQRDKPIGFAEYGPMDRLNQWPLLDAEVSSEIAAIEAAFEGQEVRSAYDGREIMSRILLGESFENLKSKEEREAAMIAYNKVLSHLPGQPLIIEPEAFHRVKVDRPHGGPLIVVLENIENESLEAAAERIAELAKSLDRYEGKYQIAVGVRGFTWEQWRALSKAVWELTRETRARFTPPAGQPVDFTSERKDPVEFLLGQQQIRLSQTRREGVRLEALLEVGAQRFKIREEEDGEISVDGSRLPTGQNVELRGIWFKSVGEGSVQITLGSETGTLKFLDPIKRFRGFQGICLAPDPAPSSLQLWLDQWCSIPMPSAGELEMAVRGLTADELHDGLEKDVQQQTILEQMVFAATRLSPSPRVEVGVAHASVQNTGYAEFTVKPGEPVVIPISVRALGRVLAECTVHWFVENLDSPVGAVEYLQQVNLAGGVDTRLALKLEGLAPGRYRVVGEVLPRHKEAQDPAGFLEMGGDLYPLAQKGDTRVRFAKAEMTVSRKPKGWVFAPKSGSPVAVAFGQPAVAFGTDVSDQAWKAMTGKGVTRKMGLVNPVDVEFTTTRDDLPMIVIDGQPVWILKNPVFGTVRLVQADKTRLLDLERQPSAELIVGSNHQLLAELKPDGTLLLRINGEPVRMDLNAMTLREGIAKPKVLVAGKTRSVKVGLREFRVGALPQEFTVHAGVQGSGKIDEGGVKIPLKGGSAVLATRDNTVRLSWKEHSMTIRPSQNRWILNFLGREELVGDKEAVFDFGGKKFGIWKTPAGVLAIRVDDQTLQIESRPAGQIQFTDEQGNKATLLAAHQGTKFSAVVEVRPPRGVDVLPQASPSVVGLASPETVVPEGISQGPRRWIGWMGWLLTWWLFARAGDLVYLFLESRAVRRIRKALGITQAESQHEISRLASVRDLLVKKGFVFFGGRRVSTAEFQRQNKEVIRLTEWFKKPFIVLSTYARSILGLTEPKKLERPSWPRRLFIPREQNKALRSFAKLYQRNVANGGPLLTQQQSTELEGVLEILRKKGVTDAAIEDLSDQIIQNLAAASKWVEQNRKEVLEKAGVLYAGKSTARGSLVLKALGKTSIEELTSAEIEAIARGMEQIQQEGVNFQKFPSDQLKLLIKYHLLDVSKENDLFAMDVGAQIFSRSSVSQAYQGLRDEPGTMLLNPAVYPIEGIREYFRGAGLFEGGMRAVAWMAQITDYGGSMLWRWVRSKNPNANTQSTVFFGVTSDAEKDPIKFMIAVKGRWLQGHLAVIKYELRGEQFHLSESFTEPVRIQENFASYSEMIRQRQKESQEATGINTRNAAMVTAAMAAQQTQNLVFPGELAKIDGLEYLGNWSQDSRLASYQELLGKDAKEGRMDPDLNIAVCDTDRGVTLILPTGDVFLILTKDKDKIARVSKGAKVGSLISMLLDQFGFKPRVRKVNGAWVTDYERVDQVTAHAPQLGAVKDEYRELREAQGHAAQAFVDEVCATTHVLHDPLNGAEVEVNLGSKSGLDPSSGLYRMLGKINWTGMKTSLFGPMSLSLLQPLADTHLASTIHAYFSPQNVIEETAQHMRNQQEDFAKLAIEAGLPSKDVQGLDAYLRSSESRLTIPWKTKADKLRFANNLLDDLEEKGIFLRHAIPKKELDTMALNHLAKGPLAGLADLIVAWEQAALAAGRQGRDVPGKTDEERRTNRLLEIGNAMIKAKRDLTILASTLSGRAAQWGQAAQMAGLSLGILNRPCLDGTFSGTTAYQLATMLQREGEYRAVGHQVARLLYHGSLDPGVFKGGDYTFGRPGVRPLRIMQAIVDPQYRQNRDWSWASVRAAVEGSQQIGSEIFSEIPRSLEPSRRDLIARFLDEAAKRGLFIQELVFPEPEANRMVVVARFAEATAYFPDNSSRLREIQDVFRQIGALDQFSMNDVSVLTPLQWEAQRMAPQFHYREAGRAGRIVRRLSPVDDYLLGGWQDTFHQYATARSEVEVNVEDLNQFLKQISTELTTGIVGRIRSTVQGGNAAALEKLAKDINVFLAEGARAQRVSPDRYGTVGAKDLIALASMAQSGEMTFVSRPLDFMRRAGLWMRGNVSPWFQKGLAGTLLAFLVTTASWQLIPLFGLITADMMFRKTFLEKWAGRFWWSAWILPVRSWLDAHPKTKFLVHLAFLAGYFWFLITPILLGSNSTIIPVFVVLFTLGSVHILAKAIAGALFDFFFFASQSLILRVLTLGHAQAVERGFRWMVHSRDIESLARIHGVEPEVLYGLWDSAGWSFAVGFPFAPGQLFGRVKVAERGGKIFEAPPVPLLIALLNLNEPPSSAVLSGFNMLPHRGWELASAFTEDTASFLGYAIATWNPNINAAAILKRKALANLIESRLYDQSPQRAAQFAKAQGILEFAIPRMMQHPLYGQAMRPYQEFLENMFGMKALREDQVSRGRENVGAGFLQYLVTAYTGEDLTEERVGPLPPGVADAVARYRELMLLDGKAGGLNVSIDEKAGYSLVFKGSRKAKFQFDKDKRMFTLTVGKRKVHISVGANPIVDPLLVTDPNGNTLNADPADGGFAIPGDYDIRIRKTGLGTIAVRIDNQTFTLAIKPQGDTAVLSKPGLYFKAIRLIQLLNGDTSGFAPVDHLIPKGLAVSLENMTQKERQAQEAQWDEQIGRLVVEHTAADSVEAALQSLAQMTPQESAAVMKDLDTIGAVADQRDAQALKIVYRRLWDLSFLAKDVAMKQKMQDTLSILERRIKENLLTERFYLPAERLGEPLVQAWVEKPIAQLRAHIERFEQFRTDYRLSGDRDMFAHPTFEDVIGLEATIESLIREKWGERRVLRPALVTSGLFGIVLPAYVGVAWLLLGPVGIGIVAISISLLAAEGVRQREQVRADRIKAVLPNVIKRRAVANTAVEAAA